MAPIKGSDNNINSEQSQLPETAKDKLSPTRALVILVLVISLVEFGSLLVTWILPPIPYPIQILLNITVLILLVSPIMYRLVIFPLHRQMIEKDELSLRLQSANQNLENLVSERTGELEKTSRLAARFQSITEISEKISNLNDLDELFSTMTNLISTSFGFYHVGIFLLDRDKENAVMQAANSEGGKRMLERGHQLKIGTGVVGYASQTGQPRIALDVGADAVFFDNPDLPATRSEVALPLGSRGEVYGILDVQSTEAGAFSNEDLQILTTLANQVSIAIENARLLSETRMALAQMQSIYNEFTRTEWSRASSRAEKPGFRFRSGRIELLDEELNNPEILSAVEKGQAETSPALGPVEKRAALAVPVKLRGQVIGVLHIESNDSSREWQDDEISLVEAVAERAAIAMENSRLFQDARRRAAKEQMISEATTRIGSTFTIENILETTAEELERVLGGSEVLIQFQSKEQP